MTLQSALFMQIALQTTTSGADWWWLIIVGLILLVAFFYWWRRVSQDDRAATVAFEKKHPLALAMPAGFVPDVVTAVSDHDDHGHGEHHSPDHPHAHADAHADAHDHEETAVAAPITPDDLKRIEGIGPKIAELLNEAGIYTFAQLADTDAADVEQILEKAGPRYKLADPASWAQQAKLAALADWTALEALQDTLKGGRHAE
jgi:predicted flap endonuclease-1-like 5' DNA nuclease